MTLSVAIACLNEGPDLEATIALLAASKTIPDEVVVFDDGSESSVEDRLARWSPWCRVITSDTRLGSGPGKHAAMEECEGDIVVVMDAHMRPPWEWADLLIEAHTQHPGAIFCARSTGFEWDGGHDGQGAVLKMGRSGFFEPLWAPPTNSREIRSVPCIYGGIYSFERTTLDEIGGYAPAYYGYGCEEEYVSLRAWLTGHECKIQPKLYVPHQYCRKINFTDRDGRSPVPWETSYNRHVAAIVCFGQEVYSKHYAGYIRLPHDCKLALIDRADEIRNTMDHIQFTRTVSDSGLEALCGVKHP